MKMDVKSWAKSISAVAYHKLAGEGKGNYNVSATSLTNGIESPKTAKNKKKRDKKKKKKAQVKNGGQKSVDTKQLEKAQELATKKLKQRKHEKSPKKLEVKAHGAKSERSNGKPAKTHETTFEEVSFSDDENAFFDAMNGQDDEAPPLVPSENISSQTAKKSKSKNRNEKKRKRKQDSLAENENGASPPKKKVTFKEPLEESDSDEMEGIDEENEIVEMSDSRREGEIELEKILSPTTLKKFFNEHWEKKPLLIKRKNEHFYGDLFSFQDFDDILRHNHLEFGKNIDITSYEDDERQTLNADGRVLAAVAWDQYQNGCSVRLLNPQTYSIEVRHLLSLLREKFNSFVGANVYLTPPDSQGFAPHYDDIEAFILQLEGKKRWKVYEPLNPKDRLPRYSSKNFKRADLKKPPIIEVTLEAGDLLYLPRGFIHEGKTLPDHHSLHITLSAAQRNTWAELLEHMLPQALQTAFEKDIEMRQSLPLDYLNYMGMANGTKENDGKRKEFIAKTKKIFQKLIEHMSVDDAVDKMGKQLVHDSLPPLLNEAERALSIYNESQVDSEGNIIEARELGPDTTIRLIRYGIVRLIKEEDSIRLYHSMENSLVYREFEPQYIEIKPEAVPAVEKIIHSYPCWMKIDELPLETVEDKMDVASLLYDKGIIMAINEDEDDDDSIIDEDEDEDDEEEKWEDVSESSDSDLATSL